MTLKLQPNLLDPALDTMNFLNEVVMSYPDAISFAPGRPVEAFFDVERELGAVSRYVDHRKQEQNCDRQTAFNALGQYGRTNGIIGDLVAGHLAADENIHVDPNAISVTVGCQEAMAMLLMALFRPGKDVLVVSDPSYVGITGTARILGIDLFPVPMHDGDLKPEEVSKALATIREQGKTPRALYHIPDFNNPLGASMSVPNRKEIIALAEAEDFLIFEDNPYGMFVYDGDAAPTMKSLDTHHRVIYMGTFSKTLFPGLRLGYVVADLEVEGLHGKTLLATELSKVKSFLTVNTSQVLQAAVGGILLEQGGSLKKLIGEKVAFYKKNRDTMIACLEKAFRGAGIGPEQVTWNKPAGGFFLTVNLPFTFDESCVHDCARDYGTIVCPMQIFSLQPGHEQQIRLSFSYVDDVTIERGVSQLARYIKDRMS